MFVKPQIVMSLNCTKMHFWSKFGDSSLNGWQVLLRTSSKSDKIWLLSQAWSTLKSMGILTVLRWTFGPNLVTLTWTDDKLSSGEAQDEVKFDFQAKFDLEGQSRSPAKIIGTLTKVFCICVPNLVILARTDDELSRGQTRDWHTDRQTDTHTQTQATTIPEGQNWPRVIMCGFVMCSCDFIKRMNWLFRLFLFWGTSY